MPRDLLAPLVTVLAVSAASLLSIDTLCHVYREYESASSKLQGEAWLRKQCRDPEFFTNMHSHTDLCLAVEADYRVGAFFLALNKVTGASTGAIETRLHGALDSARSLGWPFGMGLGAAALLCPSLVWGLWQPRTAGAFKDHRA